MLPTFGKSGAAGTHGEGRRHGGFGAHRRGLETASGIMSASLIKRENPKPAGKTETSSHGHPDEAVVTNRGAVPIYVTKHRPAARWSG
jgi:hypothetical protein